MTEKELGTRDSSGSAGKDGGRDFGDLQFTRKPSSAKAPPPWLVPVLLLGLLVLTVGGQALISGIGERKRLRDQQMLDEIFMRMQDQEQREVLERLGYRFDEPAQDAASSGNAPGERMDGVQSDNVSAEPTNAGSDE